MRKFIEHFLLSVLVGMSILLGLTFWLNVNFRFNIFSKEHWRELAILQASNAPIDKSFYISIGVAIFIFVVCMHIIYRPKFRKIPLKIPQKVENPSLPATISNEKQEEKPMNTEDKKTIVVEKPVPEIPKEPPIIEQKKPVEPEPKKLEVPVPQNMNLPRPPKLNIPKNMAQVAAAQYDQQKAKEEQEKSLIQFDDTLAEIFSNSAYLVKKNVTISGLKTNLIAIGNKEIFWFGCVDCDIEKQKIVVNKIKDTFQQTLTDIPIHVFPFMLDTKKAYNQDSDQDIIIFHDIDEVRNFILEHQGTDIEPEFQEDFEAYSEYIDTVLTLLTGN